MRSREEKPQPCRIEPDDGVVLGQRGDKAAEAGLFPQDSEVRDPPGRENQQWPLASRGIREAAAVRVDTELDRGRRHPHLRWDGGRPAKSGGPAP